MRNKDLTLEECYRILEIPYNSTQEEIEKAYKKLLIKYHPDKYASKSENEQKVASQKLEEVLIAREKLLKSTPRNYYREDYQTNYKKKTAREEYDDYLNKELEKIFRKYEEMKRKDDEEFVKMKKIAKRIIITVFLEFFGLIAIVCYLSKNWDNLSTENKEILDDLKTDEEKNDDNNISLIRTYTIKKDDEISRLAAMANCRKEEIISLNDDINVGSKIKIPYKVAEEDLDYYLETIGVNGKNLADIAKEYNTDIETLKKLNSESIVDLKKEVLIVGDTLQVPNFISKEELKIKKEAPKEKVYTK